MPSRVPQDQRNNTAAAGDHLEIAEKVRTGEYFREARAIYDLGVHDPMAERYMYVFITALALVIFIITLKGIQDLYPLNTRIPMIIAADDNGEAVPNIRSLIQSKTDDPQEVVLRFLAQHYVTSWEEYDIATFDRDASGVKSQSAPEVLKTYVDLIDPRNPDSPITLYQRHSKRKVKVLYMKRSGDEMEVVFDAEIESKTDVKKSRWRANISFQYGGLEIDQNKGNAKPIKFVVTKYHTKRLQDVK